MKIQNIKNLLFFNSSLIIILFVLLVPVFSFAANPPSSSGLVPCTNTPHMTNGVVDVQDGAVQYDSPCNFTALMALINTIIQFMLFKMAVPIAAIMFAYAGFLMVTAGGEAAHARTKAKTIFTNAVVGLVIALASWLVIRTLLSILGYNGSWIGF